MVVATSHPVQVCKLHLVCTLIPVVSPPLETQAPTLLSMKFSLGSGLAKKSSLCPKTWQLIRPLGSRVTGHLRPRGKRNHRKDTERACESTKAREKTSKALHSSCPPKERGLHLQKALECVGQRTWVTSASDLDLTEEGMEGGEEGEGGRQ